MANDATDLALPVFFEPRRRTRREHYTKPRKQDRSDERPRPAASTARPESINRGHRHVNRAVPVRDDNFGPSLRQQSPFGATELGVASRTHWLSVRWGTGLPRIESAGPCARLVAEAAIVRRTTMGVMVRTRDLRLRGTQ